MRQMKIKYDRDTLLKKLKNETVKVRIENNKPPMDVSFNDEEIQYLEGLSNDSYLDTETLDLVKETVESYSEHDDPKISQDSMQNMIVGVQADSLYFDCPIEKTLKKGEHFQDIVYSPVLLEYDNKILEFRITSVLGINLYDPDKNEAVSILSRSRDMFEAEVGFIIDDIDFDVDYEDVEVQSDVDEFEISDSSQEIFHNIKSEFICVIPLEINTAIALQNEFVRDRLYEHGIDAEKMTGENTKVYLNGEPLIFQDRYSSKSICDLLSNREYRLNYEQIRSLETYYEKWNQSRNFNRSVYKEYYDLINHNQKINLNLENLMNENIIDLHDSEKSKS